MLSGRLGRFLPEKPVLSGLKLTKGTGRTCIRLKGLLAAINFHAEQLVSGWLVTRATVSMPSQHVNDRIIVRSITIDDKYQALFRHVRQAVIGHDEAQMFNKGCVVEPTQLVERELVIGKVQKSGTNDHEHQQKRRHHNQEPAHQMLFECTRRTPCAP